MYDPVPEHHGQIPVSAGIPPLIRWSGIIGLIAIFIVVGIVIGASRYGHVWPSGDSAHIQLAEPAK
jgi:hypothetical protein